jgi:2-methylcitrate dehydratase PrpD
MTRPRELSRILGDFVAHTRYEDVPDEVLEYGKRILLDTLACTIGGCAVQPRHDMFLQVARALGGAPVSTILVSGERVDPVTAASVNAEAGGALSAQESLYFTHTANVTASVALALAERDCADGRSLLLAFVVGYEVTALLGLLRPVALPPATVRSDGGRSTRDVYVSVGAAAAAARALGLDADRSAEALAIAAATAPGDARRPRLSCLNYVGFHHKARCGATAALLAEQGLSGYDDVLDVHRAAEEAIVPDRTALLAGLGTTWWTLDACIKLYPTTRYLSGPIEQFDRIVGEEQLDPQEIEHVTVQLSPLGLSSPHIASASLDLDARDPAAPLNLVFNAPYQVAMVALGIPPGPAWYDPARFGDPAVRDLMHKVSLENDPVLGERMIAEAQAALHGRVRSSGGAGVIVQARGESFVGRSEEVGGDPWSMATRITDAQLATKLRMYADSLLPAEQVERACELVLELERVQDVNELTRLLVTP